MLRYLHVERDMKTALKIDVITVLLRTFLVPYARTAMEVGRSFL
jgi:hypothetical protein